MMKTMLGALQNMYKTVSRSAFKSAIEAGIKADLAYAQLLTLEEIERLREVGENAEWSSVGQFNYCPPPSWGLEGVFTCPLSTCDVDRSTRNLREFYGTFDQRMDFLCSGYAGPLVKIEDD
jgi:hypothetical protein